MRSGRERLDRAAHINNTVPENARFIGLCHLALPNARIVHMRRDPMEVCLSCFATLFKRGVHTYSYDLAELGRYSVASRPARIARHGLWAPC
jgi:hypothetical protein